LTRTPKAPIQEAMSSDETPLQPTTPSEGGKSPEIRKRAELACKFVNNNQIGVSHLPSNTGNATSSVGVAHYFKGKHIHDSHRIHEPTVFPFRYGTRNKKKLQASSVF
jgi:hypothetical protein